MNTSPHGGPLAPPVAVQATTSRRRKLWEIPHKFHCPVIGVCFECAELRGLMAKVMHFPRTTSDFVLHTTAVSHCEERTRLAELLQKTLEKRYRLTVGQFAILKTNADLRAAWRQACREGSRIPASLWAAWTHPACDSELERDIYADIHMIQHQVGSGNRADLKEMQALTAENRELRRAQAGWHGELEGLRRERAEIIQGVAMQITELRQELVAREAREAGVLRELAALKTSVPDLVDRQMLHERLQAAHQQMAEMAARQADLDKELFRLRECARFAEDALAAFTREDDRIDALPASDLSGKSVLCVGGRAGAVHSYRDVVEQSGGRFLHHDGGLEESLHRIDGVLAAADIVICQAGCISHNAYWRVKDLCKRTGKPCMFVKNGSVSSFERILDDARRKS